MDDQGVTDVLYVGSDPERTGLVVDVLEDEGLSVATVDPGEAADRAGSAGCLVTTHGNGVDGLAVAEAAMAASEELSVVLFPAEGSEALASRAVSVGVDEYVRAAGEAAHERLAERVRALTDGGGTVAEDASVPEMATLVENLPGMVYRCRNEPDWPMSYVSEGCRDLTGYDPDALVAGEVVWGEDVLHPEDREEMWERVQQALDAGEPFEVTYRIRTADDELRWAWERGRQLPDGRLEGFVTDITPRKRREQELAAQREFIDSALDALDDAFYVVDPETGTLERWNDKLVELSGYSDAELASMRSVDLVADEDIDTLAAATEQAMETGSLAFEAEVVTKEGERVPFEFRGSTLYDADGERIGLGGVGRDISERKARERDLRRYETLVESVGDPMYMLNPDGSVRMVNRALAEVAEQDRAELEGAPVSRFLSERDVERGVDVIRDLLGSEERARSWEIELDVDSGQRAFENKTAVITDDDGEFVGSAGVIRDITERKARERDLERYETIIHAVGDPVYALDDEGRFTFVNDAFESMTGYDTDELLGEEIGTVMREEDVAEGNDRIRELLGEPGRRASTLEVQIQPAAGDSIPSELHIALLPFEEEFRGTAGIIRDIQERKAREERLEEFASVVSHDLRGPLNVVLGGTQLARETGDVEELDRVFSAAQRMETLIDDLLTLAREGQTVGETEPVALADLAETAWEGLDTGEARMTCSTTRTVDADPDRLRELFENLFRNAVEHGSTSPDSGTRQDAAGRASDESSVADAPEDAVEHGSTSPDSRARQDPDDAAVTVTVTDDENGFAVADDGAGIPPEEREAVFEHGHTTSDEGTGFGLSIVRRIARAHGWSVHVEESESGGARFVVET